ncbi:hypothetical protein [Nocardia salmonicida]|uniref:hypothetical protein n=1 Tax=Nocardia salmonicida TaxID=53431 RepID=UPI002E2B8CAB|nr:hypothetical protein [Nocardia salmonicida]
MPETIIITPSNVRAGGNELLAAKTAFDAILNTLATTVESNGSETWGDDSYGKQFADGDTGYRSSRSNLLSGGRDMAETVGEFGTGLVSASNKADTTEFHSTSAF